MPPLRNNPWGTPLYWGIPLKVPGPHHMGHHGIPHRIPYGILHRTTCWAHYAMVLYILYGMYNGAPQGCPIGCIMGVLFSWACLVGRPVVKTTAVHESPQMSCLVERHNTLTSNETPTHGIAHGAPRGAHLTMIYPMECTMSLPMGCPRGCLSRGYPRGSYQDENDRIVLGTKVSKMGFLVGHHVAYPWGSTH